MYTVPYTVFSTGIGYRADRIDPAVVEAAGWDMLWDPTYKGVTSILDDYRESLSMAMLRRGLTDVNTTDEAVIRQAGADLGELTDSDEHQGQHRGLQGRPRGRRPTSPTPGAATCSPAPPRTCPRAPTPRCSAGGTRPTASASSTTTCMAVTANAKNPVLAHLYINFLLDAASAEENFAWNGYLPPIKGLDADYLIAQGYVPENLRAAVLDRRADQQGPALPAAAARDRPALGRRVVEVHRRLASVSASHG